jgi:putative restriction endonuclease
MQGYVANTDFDWYSFLRDAEPPLRDVNFWKPSAEVGFGALSPGEPFFFKLKKPHYAICGFGFFVHYSHLPASLAWEVYGQANGAPTFGAMRERLVRIRERNQMGGDPRRDFEIGCILVNEAVFFAPDEWVRMPEDFAKNIVGGKRYDLREGEGRRVWEECRARAADHLIKHPLIADSVEPAEWGGYGSPALTRPRLGQNSFRVAILDTYQRRCSVTGERTLPVLEAAHIRDFAELERHSINNGLLLRSDLHKLFDKGYVTVDPDYHFVVSQRIKEEWENGREYYAMHGREIRLPAKPIDVPSLEFLRWHNEERFRG